MYLVVKRDFVKEMMLDGYSCWRWLLQCWQLEANRVCHYRVACLTAKFLMYCRDCKRCRSLSQKRSLSKRRSVRVYGVMLVWLVRQVFGDAILPREGSFPGWLAWLTKLRGCRHGSVPGQRWVRYRRKVSRTPSTGYSVNGDEAVAAGTSATYARWLAS